MMQQTDRQPERERERERESVCVCVCAAFDGVMIVVHCSASEVLLDVLTGEVEILRTDMLFDCGTSLNPLIDIGQAEGGFIMGVGYFMTERLEWTNVGKLTTNGTWEYKPPFAKDIPIDLRIDLLKNTPNPLGILGYVVVVVVVAVAAAALVRCATTD
jgi:CO/xanthine dehydrogenase Mo-binding subunit